MTSTTSARIYLGVSRVRRLRLAAVVAFLVMTIAAAALFFITLELSLRLPPSNPYSDIYLLVASAGPLAVLLHGLGVLVIWRHTDHNSLELVGRSRVLIGGLACTLLAAAAAILTPLVAPPPFSSFVWITAASPILTATVAVWSRVALRAGPSGGHPGAPFRAERSGPGGA